MRILATLDYPTLGTAEVCGINVVDRPSEVRRLIGWMPDHFGNYDHMTVVEYLDFYARALGYKGKERRERIQEVMEFTDLIPLSDRFSNKLSKGMTQRLGLGRALLHDPQVLIMDEPAAGLDPKARVELKHLIRVLAKEGKTIFISSHILSELGEMCDSLLFIDNGRIVHHGDADSLKRDADGITLLDVQLASGGADRLREWASLSPLAEFVIDRKRGGRLKVESQEPEEIAAVLRRMVTDGLPIIEFRREERNLEDAFIHILGKLDKAPPHVPATPPPIAASPIAAPPAASNALPRPE
ncbi:ABC transporter ATP-binding protein [soil metagenome]